MPDEGFPLPSSSYKELAKIIKAYGTYTGDTAPADIGTVAGVHQTSVSANNGFLVAIGIVEGGKRKHVTSIGAALALALEHEMPDEISAKWRDIVVKNEFFQKLIAAVRIRKGMEESALEAHIAYSAGQSKTPRVMAGAGAVVEILRASGLVKEQDGKLVAIPTELQLSPGESMTETATATPGGQVIQTAVGTVTPVVTGGVPQISIQIQIQCTPDSIDELRPKLRALLEELAQAERQPTRSGTEKE